MALVTLNAKNYVVRRIRRYTADPRGNQQRTTGEYQVSDNGKVTAAIFDGTWADKGIFWNKNRRRTGRGVGGIWKSQAETRFHHGIYNGLMEHEQTQPTTLGHVKRYVNFNSDLYALLESDYSASVLGVGFLATFSGSTDAWTQSANSPPTVNAANADGSSGAQASGTSITVTHTVQSALANRIVLAFVQCATDSNGASSVTYDGDSMTKFIDVNDGTICCQLWYKTSPSTGSGVSCTANGLSGAVGMNVVDYSGASLSNPLYNTQSTTGTGTNPSVDIVAQQSDVVVHMHAATTVVAFTHGGAQTYASAQSGNFRTFGGHYDAESDGVTTTTTTWSDSTSARIGIACALRGLGLVGGSQAVAEGTRCFDLVPHKGHLFSLLSGGINGATETAYMVRSTVDGTSWVDADNAAGAIFPSTVVKLTTTITRRNNFDDDGARLLDDGNLLWAFVYDYVNKDIECYTSADATTQGSETWVLEFSIPSADGPKGAAVWFDRSGTKAPLLATVEGVYALDATNNLFTMEIPMDGQVGNGRWMTVGDDGDLYVPLGEDDILHVYFSGQQTNGNPTMITERIGPMSAHDGMPAEWRGRANYIMSGNSPGGLATRWLWVFYGGHAASEFATILCYDYDASRRQGHPVWHCFHDTDLNSITGMGAGNVDLTMAALSVEDDALPRLHVAAEGTTESILFHFEEPLVDHDTQSINTAGEGSKYLASCKVQFASDDHGDPHTGGAVHLGRVDAHGLSTSGTNTTKIEWLRDVLDGVWGTTYATGTQSTSTFYSNNETVTLGSGLGVSDIGSSHELRFIRNSGDSTEKAILHEFQVLYHKQVADLKGYELEIDLVKTAEAQRATVDAGAGLVDAEDVIDSLEAIESSVTLVALTVGKQAAINVEMVGNEWEYELVDDGGTEADIDTGRVGKGTAIVRLEERL